MKKTIFTFLSVFAIITSPFCQTKEYDLIDQIKNSDSSTTLVYLNATWCHPCMQKLGGIVSNFGNRPSIKLIVLFDRSGFEKYKSRLFELHDSSYFRFLSRFTVRKKRSIVFCRTITNNYLLICRLMNYGLAMLSLLRKKLHTLQRTSKKIN